MKRALPLAVLLTVTATAQAGWQDTLKGLLGDDTGSQSTSQSTSQSSTSALSEQELTGGINEALSVGVKRAVALLGRQGGYLDDAQVRIPLPGALQPVDRMLRAVGQQRYADQFVASMNHAAEQAVPVATDIFLQAIQQMKLNDARAIVNGPPDAATRYFQTHTTEQLRTAFLPIVRRATDQTQVTARYKALMSQAGGMSSLVNTRSLDLDRYVTDRALDGLFLKLAQEEERIRKDPVARSTELLRQVFGR